MICSDREQLLLERYREDPVLGAAAERVLMVSPEFDSKQAENHSCKP